MTVKELQRLVDELQEKVARLEEENRRLKSQSKPRNRKTFLVAVPLWVRIIEHSTNIVSVGNDAERCYITGRKPAKFAVLRLTTDMVSNKQLRKVIYEFINNGEYEFINNGEQENNSDNNGNSSNGQVEKNEDFDDDIF